MPNNASTDISLPEFEWTRLLGSNEPEEGHALTIGADGSIYIVGHTWGDFDGQINNGGYGDAFLTKFNPNGTTEWSRLLGTSDIDYGNALTTGSDGSIYIAGTTTSDLDSQT